MEIFSQWRDALGGVLHQTVERLALYLPNVFGAFLLLFIGWIVAHLLRAAAVRLTLLGEGALARLSARRGRVPSSLPRASAKILGSVVFLSLIHISEPTRPY